MRAYLAWLADPSSIVDPAAVDAADQLVQQETDVIAKLKAISRADRVRSGDPVGVKAAFVKHAKSWGESNEITASAWSRVGVPPEMLREAGITKRQKRNRTPTSTGTKHSPVTAARVASHIQTLTEPFLLVDVIAAVGGSPMTIRKAVEQLIASGHLSRVGPDPNHDGRGRAPILYRTKK